MVLHSKWLISQTCQQLAIGWPNNFLPHTQLEKVIHAYWSLMNHDRALRCDNNSPEFRASLSETWQRLVCNPGTAGYAQWRQERTARTHGGHCFVRCFLKVPTAVKWSQLNGCTTFPIVWMNHRYIYSYYTIYIYGMNHLNAQLVTVKRRPIFIYWTSLTILSLNHCSWDYFFPENESYCGGWEIIRKRGNTVKWYSKRKNHGAVRLNGLFNVTIRDVNFGTP
jgi:hypothetical protein